MVPSSFVVMDAFPHTRTGKIDRLALPDPGHGRPELEIPFVPPKSAIERELSQIWTVVLGLDQIGLHDPFLELGGDSLRATQIISRVLDKFQVEIPIHTLMQSPTIAEMAEVILNHKTKQIEPDGMKRLLDEVEKSSSDD
jgi:acyl carrier protein